MTRISAIAALLTLFSAGAAFGASPDFVFFNKLGALVILNGIAGVFLAFFTAVIASRVLKRVRVRFALSRVPAIRARRSDPDHGNGTVSLHRKVVNG